MSRITDEIDELLDDESIQQKEVIRRLYKTYNENDLISMNKTIYIQDNIYDDFKESDFPYSLNFYDFEVFEADWMVVIINVFDYSKKIIVNNKKALREYYDSHKEQIWVGYNSGMYDSKIHKGILSGLNPKEVSDKIIQGDTNISFDANVGLYDFDVMTDKGHSLKELEGFMGSDIEETSVDFDIDRPLTRDEILDTIKYCIHDVEQTIEVFRRRKNEYFAHMDLINTFNLGLSAIRLTKAQMTANIIDCKKPIVDRDDEFDLRLVDTLEIKKYRNVVDWFCNKKNMNYDKKTFLITDVCGIPHTFRWGGLHGCVDKPIHIIGDIIHADVTSFYPSIMIEYDMLTRNCRKKSKFKEIYDKRVELKKAGKKKEQAPYKIILNATYGISKYKYSKAYDPLMANNVCVNGQLLLLDLLEHLESEIDLIQSNTDGIFFKIKSNKEKVMEICYEWEKRTRMGLSFDEVKEIYQKDVNNYLIIYKDGKVERIGSYVKELNDLDYDLPIVNEAIVNYLVLGIKVEETINNCNELIKFQKIVKISSKYERAYHNSKYLHNKVFRVFASSRLTDSSISKVKESEFEKFANTPDHCFIDNSDIRDKYVPYYLDKNFYISLVYKRLKGYGIEMGGLF